MPPSNRHLHVSEAFTLRITLIAGALDAVLVVMRGATVDIPAYGQIVGLVAVLLLVGAAYRGSGRSEAIGATAICAGLFILFTAALSLFNYLLVPNGRPLIDPWLIRIDASLGYDWPSIIEWAARHLWFNEAMRLAYMTTLPQIAILVVVLGLTMRLRDLHSLLATVTIGGAATVLFWGLFPSAGAKAFHDLPDGLLLAVQPIVDSSYGDAIVSLVQHGARFLSPNELRGLIAFPSFHIVLACIATYHARNVRWLFIPYALINLVVLPAVLVHGGHHLVDIPAGMLMFLLALSAAHVVALPRDASLPVLA